jgi:hypothetical protein
MSKKIIAINKKLIKLHEEMDQLSSDAMSPDGFDWLQSLREQIDLLEKIKILEKENDSLSWYKKSWVHSFVGILVMILISLIDKIN